MPVEGLGVEQVDGAGGFAETLAASGAGEAWAGGAGRRACPRKVLKRILSWCRKGGVFPLSAGAAAREGLSGLAPGVAGRDLLVCPLGAVSGECGVVLVLAAGSGRVFTASHRALAQACVEPLGVALGNDRRWREMRALQEAAEAERQSLLNRLGRRKLGDTIVGAEAGLQAVMERVRLVARSDVPVLIFGETGSGKELIARAIHHGSPRAAHAFIRVNCGAIAPELMDSELFGHERGAFTGAVQMRRGWFERADRGTLFLDEIGDLPAAAQVRLLRILQDGWFARVGAEQALHVDVRVVAATHRDLAQMVALGRFREDLWYRLAVFPIILPPLRERQEDIPALARHFAERAATRFGLRCVLPTAEDIGLLSAYAWPGNVREFATVIDRAAILGDGEQLEVAKALGFAAGAPGPPKAPPAAPQAAVPAAGIVPLAEAIRACIEMALRASRGRVDGAHGCARLLGVNPNTLRAKMRKLGIDRRRFAGEGGACSPT
ncbi:MAG: sigma-54-dependent Fis family transcriptional regulator [Kiritimatiellae bacterium]|nr:sigma-54-dependent Fis family transcriptional regulator [Kiritimatiellia bacterium]